MLLTTNIYVLAIVAFPVVLFAMPSPSNILSLVEPVSSVGVIMRAYSTALLYAAAPLHTAHPKIRGLRPMVSYVLRVFAISNGE